MVKQIWNLFESLFRLGSLVISLTSFICIFIGLVFGFRAALVLLLLVLVILFILSLLQEKFFLSLIRPKPLQLSEALAVLRPVVDQLGGRPIKVFTIQTSVRIRWEFRSLFGQGILILDDETLREYLRQPGNDSLIKATLSIRNPVTVVKTLSFFISVMMIALVPRRTRVLFSGIVPRETGYFQVKLSPFQFIWGSIWFLFGQFLTRVGSWSKSFSELSALWIKTISGVNYGKSN